MLKVYKVLMNYGTVSSGLMYVYLESSKIEEGTEKNLKKMAEVFPNLMKIITPNTQVVQWKSGTRNMKVTTSTHIKINYLKYKQ